VKRPITNHTVDRFLRISGYGPTRFGRQALNDPTFVQKMRAGIGIGPTRAAKIETFIRSYIKAERAKVVKLDAFLGGEIDE
jgi:hypothetical protein